MKVQIKNFGKIKKGKINLYDRFSVFVGYNNTGKTYLSQLLWSLNSYENQLKYDGSTFISDNLINLETFTFTDEIIQKVIDGYKIYITKNILPELFFVNESYFSEQGFSIDFLDDFCKSIKDFSYYYVSVIRNDKAGQDSNLGYYYFTKDADSLEVKIGKKIFDEPKKINSVLPDSIYKEINTGEIKRPISVSYDNAGLSNEQIFKKAISQQIFWALFNKYSSPFFLPANRVFYPSYYKYIYSVAKEEKDLIGDRINSNKNLKSIKDLSKRSYTKATDELIERIYKLSSSSKVVDYYKDLLTDLEEIIGGEITIKSSEGYAPIEFLLTLQDGKKLDMYMASSSANQLATLYLYLKYWVNNSNNLLIIDEPEENLHPENQIKLINVLMKFADKNNNRVLITTHSPLISELINNYADISYLKEEGLDTLDLVKKNDLNMISINEIKHSDYGIYFFDTNSVKNYKVGDYGAYFKDFQTAQDKIKDVSNTLRNEIYKKLNPDA